MPTAHPQIHAPHSPATIAATADHRLQAHTAHWESSANPAVQRIAAYAQIANSPAPIQRQAAPQGGLPANLKSGIEGLSGIAMDDVRVHYNSSKPAQLQAHAYAQGTDIHIAPGQERHLPHEAWHVVQQKQGRVKPTLQLKGVAINDDSALEREADVMGGRAVGGPQNHSITQRKATGDTPHRIAKSRHPIQRMITGIGTPNIWGSEIAHFAFREQRNYDANPFGRKMSLKEAIHRLHSIEEVLTVNNYGDLVRRITSGNYDGFLKQSIAENPQEAKYDLQPIFTPQQTAASVAGNGVAALSIPIADQRILGELVIAANTYGTAATGDGSWGSFTQTMLEAKKIRPQYAQKSCTVIRKMCALARLGDTVSQSFPTLSIVTESKADTATAIRLIAPELATAIRDKIKITVNALEVGGESAGWTKVAHLQNYLRRIYEDFLGMFAQADEAGRLRLLRSLRADEANVEKFSNLLTGVMRMELARGGSLATQVEAEISGHSTAAGGKGLNLANAAYSWLWTTYLESKYTEEQIENLDYQESSQAFLSWARRNGITYVVIRDIIRRYVPEKTIEAAEIKEIWDTMLSREDGYDKSDLNILD